MSQNFCIDNRLIGEQYPTYIIAEIGINHNGDEDLAHKLIDEAAQTGADAVKFQKRHLPSLYPEEVLTHPENFEQSFQYMIPILKEIELSEAAFRRLKQHCDDLGLFFLCTPFDAVSLQFLESIGTMAYKVASADLTNIDLIEQICLTNKPMILSTGMSTWLEVEQTVNFLKEQQGQFALLHCRSVYPVWPREVNLRRITRLKDFGYPVGYSGHELGITVPLVAASMGASIIEKHITLDPSMSGPDHKSSLTPYEFKRMVRDIHIADEAIGREKRFLLRGEVLNRELFGKSLVAARTINIGETITREMVKTKGPAKGLSPQVLNQLLDKQATRHIKTDQPFLEKDIQDHKATPLPSYNFNSQWGLIARFVDAKPLLAYQPKVLEFHLAEKDFTIPHNLHESYDCRLIVHGPEYMGNELHDLCSQDADIRKRSVELVIQTMQLTQEITPFFKGKTKVITHPGAMSLNTKLPRQAMSNNLAQSLKEIRQNDFADMELLIENLPPYPWYFGGQWKGNFFMAGQEIVDFCTTNNIRICFDLSHAALACNAKDSDLAEMIKLLLPITSHLHLADGYGLDGEGVQFEEGDIDLANILPLFCDFKGTWVPEIWRGHLNHGQGFLQALDYLQPYFD